jgi:putative CocE/NonD family hydrolase
MSYHPTAAHDDHPPLEIVSGTPDRSSEVVLLADRVATMRDGIALGADVYLPTLELPLPAVVLRQPYGRRTPGMGFEEVARFFARKGYACVVQDVRGKFSSGGAFDPGVHEVDDGTDTVDWVASEPWCDGRVGLWGESYYGFTAVAAAVGGHPAIRCIAPGDIAVDRRAAWFRQGAFLLNTTGTWALAMDAPEYADVSGVDPYHLPLVELGRPVGLEGAYLRAILTRLEDAAWWRQRGLRHRLHEVRVPVLSWSGWWDTYLGAQLREHAELLASHPQPATVHLLVGPWDHEGSGEHTDRVVCVPVPPTAEHRWDAYQAFFDRYLLDADVPAPPAADVFTIGPNRWRELPAWPPPDVRPTPLFLRADGRAALAAPTDDEPPDTFTYDPADPLPELVGRNGWALCAALGDRRRFDDRIDVLRYVGEPLADDLELTGPLSARLFAASSAVDTDFTVTLADVFPDGTVNTVADGIVRARYRRGLDRPVPLVPGAVEAYDVDLHATSYVVRAGHRLRVDVSSSCFDRYDRNPNTGAPVGTATTTVVARQTIHHAPGRASHVLLPVRRSG